MEQHLVQILVEVATIPVKPLKTEVETGSVWTAIGHGWVVPKRKPNGLTCYCFITIVSAKGNLVNILERRFIQKVEDCVVTQRNCNTTGWELRRVFFSF